MADPFVAEIRILAFDYAPAGWARCDGQLLPLAQNTALFSLLGTVYGGDGKSTFALPDLQGRVPMHPGQGQGLADRALGEMGGAETVAIDQSTMPAHGHALRASPDAGELQGPGSTRVMGTSVGAPAYVPATPDSNLSPGSLTPAGGGTPHENMQPYLAMTFCIALQGVYPPRS